MINKETRDGSAYDDVFVGDIDEAALANVLEDRIIVDRESHYVFPAEGFEELPANERALVLLLGEAAASKLEHDDWLHVRRVPLGKLGRETGASIDRLKRDNWIAVSDDGARIRLPKVNEIVEWLQDDSLEGLLVPRDRYTESNHE